MKTALFFVALCTVLVLATVGKEIQEEKQVVREYQFDVIDDSTILISGGNNGDDWYTISTDSLKEFIIEDNQ